MNRLVSLILVAVLVAVALVSGGCGGPIAAPALPDGSTALQRGMTLAAVQKSLGSPGVVETMSRESPYATKAEFDRPPRYPKLDITVFLGAWGGPADSVAGWSYRNASPEPTSRPVPKMTMRN